MPNETYVDLTSTQGTSQEKIDEKKVEPQPTIYEETDPSIEVSPKPSYAYKRIILPANKTSDPEIDEILNSCSSIVRWDEKILPDNSLQITVIYAKKEVKKTNA